MFGPAQTPCRGSATNESGTLHEPSTRTKYTYDTDSTCGPSSGDLVKKVDAAGNVTCSTYDTLHRLLTIKCPSGPNSGNTPSKYLAYDGSSYWPQLTNTKGRFIGGHTCFEPCTALITDMTMGYTARGEISDVYESTPNSGGYYHTSATYWPNGALSSLSGIPGEPTYTYGVDGEGRNNSVTQGSAVLVSNVVFNPAGQVTDINFGNGDHDHYQYAPNTGRQTQYSFTVGATPQTYTGTLTWNANGTLQQLAISDPFNSSDNQTCTYGYDDIVRVSSANCGSVWSQTFSYDPFGNITKTGSIAEDAPRLVET